MIVGSSHVLHFFPLELEDFANITYSRNVVKIYRTSQIYTIGNVSRY